MTVRAHWDGDEEARVIGDDIENFQRKGERLNDMAILVRASFQMRAFEDRFITLGVPYRVVGGPRFYERAEIRDALAYLKIIASPDNDLAFERIINTPKRGIGDTSVKRMHEHCPRPGHLALPRGGGAEPHRRTARQDPHGAAQADRKLLALAPDGGWAAAHGACRNRSGRVRLHRDVAERQEPGGRRAASRTSRNSCAPWANSRTSRASSSTSRWSWTSNSRPTTTRSTS